jgi:hypothetical protein
LALLKVSPSGQVYDIELPVIRVTPDQGGGYYLHGQGHFMFFEELEKAQAKKREIEVYRAFGGPPR